MRRTQDSPQTQSAGGAARAACDDLYWELSRWLGFDGCHALFTRALAQARVEHPALSSIALRVRSDPYVYGVAESIAAHGDEQVAAALEAMLIYVVDLLGRIIGDDMAAKLIEQSIVSTRGASNSDRKEPRTEP